MRKALWEWWVFSLLGKQMLDLSLIGEETSNVLWLMTMIRDVVGVLTRAGLQISNGVYSGWK